jgi:hypothetical protein
MAGEAGADPAESSMQEGGCGVTEREGRSDEGPPVSDWVRRSVGPPRPAK